MEDKLQQLISRSIPLTGVIYVGANDGEEFVQCKQHGIENLLAFEPLPAAYERLRRNHPDVEAFNLGLGVDTYVTTMEITENDKASSTLPRIPVEDWRTHEVFKDWNMGQWPIVGTTEVQIARFDDLNINTSKYNILCIDVQGMELEVLMGFSDKLFDFDALSVELSETPVYQGEASADEVIEFLKDYMFDPITPVSKHDDVLFVKRHYA